MGIFSKITVVCGPRLNPWTTYHQHNYWITLSIKFLLIVTVSVARQGHLAITAKARSESSESLSSPSVVKSVKNIWDKPEDRIAVIGLGIAAIVGFWASLNFVAAIDRLPLIPGVFEFIGILFSSWFVYRYLLFKPNREELFQAINKSLSDILDQ